MSNGLSKMNTSSVHISQVSTLSFNAGGLKKEIDTDGFLVHYDVPIARSGAFQYRAYEFGFSVADGYDPNELINVYRHDNNFREEVLQKNSIIPFTNNHPNGKVDIDNARYVNVGAVTGLYFKDNVLYASEIKIYDQDTIDDIEKGDKKEVSIGFEARYEVEPVTIDGVTYDGLEEVVRINQLSLVAVGKAGHEFKMHKEEKSRMSNAETVKTTVNGVEVELSAEQAIALNQAETKKMFDQVNLSIESIANSVKELAEVVTRKNEEENKDDCKNEDEAKEDETKEDVAENKCTSKNEDKEEKDEKEDEYDDDAHNEEKEEDKDDTKDAKNGEAVVKAMESLYSANSSSKSMGPTDRYYTADQVLNSTSKRKFSDFEIMAAVRNKYCA